ncbi:MAG: hypothetical protein H6591_03595 [Flavobacteriales bacterium]|nr:hypothetical protein [Flavobacteriales bacterium]
MAGVLIRLLSRTALVRLLWVVGTISLVLVGWTISRILSMQQEQRKQMEEEEERRRRLAPTSAAEQVRFASLRNGHRAAPTSELGPAGMGLGMMAPHMRDGAWLFYASPDPDHELMHPVVVDSLVFGHGVAHPSIDAAPPWFVPAHLKLDHDLLLLRAITMSASWVEVVVNEGDGRTAWVERAQGELRLWPDFILAVATVEVIDPVANPMRTKPMEQASIRADGTSALLTPLAVQGDWLLVRAHGSSHTLDTTGWVRWRKGDSLLVNYKLLC